MASAATERHRHNETEDCGRLIASAKAQDLGGPWTAASPVRVESKDSGYVSSTNTDTAVSKGGVRSPNHSERLIEKSIEEQSSVLYDVQPEEMTTSLRERGIPSVVCEPTLTPHIAPTEYQSSPIQSGSQQDLPSDGPEMRIELLEGIDVYAGRKNIKLKVLNETMDDVARCRFDDLQELFIRDISARLSKSKNVFRPWSLRPLMLETLHGKSAPYAVLFCNKGASKCARRFFRKDTVREQFNPLTQDVCRPCIGVFISSPPVMLAQGQWDIDGRIVSHEARSLSTEQFSAYTAMLQFRRKDREEVRIATMSGGIKAYYEDGTTALFGMTAGHIFNEDFDLPAESDDSLFDTGSEDSIITTINQRAEDSTSYLTPTTTSEATITSDTNPPKYTHFRAQLFKTSDAFADLADLAELLTADLRYTSLGEMDWALIECHDYFDQLMHICELGFEKSYRRPERDGHLHAWLTDQSAKYDEARPTLPVSISQDYSLLGWPVLQRASTECINVCDQLNEVLILTATQGILRGVLSKHLYLFNTYTCSKPIKIFTVRLKGQESLKKASSGSWVIDYKSGLVHGDLIASDPLGDGYVVPLLTTLRTMRDALGADSVTLASPAEIRNHLLSLRQPAESLSSKPPQPPFVNWQASPRPNLSQPADRQPYADLSPLFPTTYREPTESNATKLDDLPAAERLVVSTSITHLGNTPWPP